MATEEDLRQRALPPLDLELGFCIVMHSTLGQEGDTSERGE